MKVVVSAISICHPCRTLIRSDSYSFIYWPAPTYTLQAQHYTQGARLAGLNLTKKDYFPNYIKAAVNYLCMAFVLEPYEPDTLYPLTRTSGSHNYAFPGHLHCRALGSCQRVEEK